MSQIKEKAKSQPRILHYIDTENFAGTERHILDLASELSQHSVDATVACPSRSILGQKARAQNVSVLSIDGQKMLNLRAIRQLRRMLRSGQIDILHAHNGRSVLSCAVAKVLARRGRLVFTQHFIQPAHSERSGIAARLFDLVHQVVYRSVDAFIANSQAARAAMIERGECEAHRIEVTPLGIASPDLKSVQSPASVRDELNVGNAPLVVCVARLEREKDVQTLIAAMKIVVTQMPTARAVIAGQGSEKEALKNQINATNLQNHVQLLGFRGEVWSLMGAADVFVLPSLAEPFGLVLLEAMAMQKPIIATRAGGPLEIVQDGETGLLVPPASAVAMANSIHELLGNAARAEAMGRLGHARWQEQFTVARMAAKTSEVYRRVLEKS